jgi:hypothetical protein
MKRIPLVFLSLLSLLQIANSNSQKPPSFLDSVPALTHWEAAEQGRTTEAEAYMKSSGRDSKVLSEYGFVRELEQDFVGQDGKISTEIFEMMDSAAAYGYFTFARERNAKPLERIGNIGQELEHSIIFAQNRYFVQLTARGDNTSLRAGLLRIGNAISHLLPTSYLTPAVVVQLPRENLVRNSTVFVLGMQALSRKCPSLGDKDIFGLANGAEAVVADYQFPGDSATLLLITYPTQQLAKKFLESGYRAFAAQNPDQPAFYKREGPLAVLVFGTKSAEAATTLLDRISYASMVSWDPKTQPLGVARMMLNIFLYTGVMLSFALIAGILFGLFRITIKRILPGRVFDRPEDTELIRLNLQFPRE